MCKRPAGPAGLLVLTAVIALSMLAPLAGSPSPARADGTYRAGVAQITVQDAVSGVVGFGDAQMLPVPFEVLIAYPTDVAEAPFEAGPFTIHASLNAPRTHLALDKDAPVSRPVQRIGVVRSLAILGGLHHHYARA